MGSPCYLARGFYSTYKYLRERKGKIMGESKVYFTSFKTTEHENLIQKLHRLMKQAGFENIDFNEKYAAIKIHFGEYGNLAFLRPNYAKVVADYVKELGGKHFLRIAIPFMSAAERMRWIIWI